MSKYEVVIGLEVHAQLKTVSKMFCTCDNMSVDAEPNTNVCPVCLGFPGMLPVANKKAIEWTYMLGLALGGKISDKWNFERKNYFYPDLPKAYQITSATNPPVIGGGLVVVTDPSSVIPGRKPGTQSEGNTRDIRIHHIHLEEDAGKLVHPAGKNYSLVDLNRAGTPLMEIVTEPDLRSAREARIFMQDLRAILRYLGISDANLEQGNMRCDANISLRPVGQKEYGTRAEIKNINSFKMVERAIEYEIERQTETLDSGEKVKQETRGWDDNKGKTLPQRSKEEANDYRYFPEPDLPPISQSGKNVIDVAAIKSMLPELPKEKAARFVSEYGLSTTDAAMLTSDLDTAKYFEQTLEEMPEIAGNSEIAKAKAKKVANWILSERITSLNAESISIMESKVTPNNLATLIEGIDSGKINGKMGKAVLSDMHNSGMNFEQVVKEQGYVQVSDTVAIMAIVDEVIAANEKSVNDFQEGKQQAFGYLIGQVMAKTKGQANPKVVNEILRERLK